MLIIGLLAACLIIAGLWFLAASRRPEEGTWVVRCDPGSAEATTLVVTQRRGAWYDTASGKRVALPEGRCVFSQD